MATVSLFCRRMNAIVDQLQQRKLFFAAYAVFLAAGLVLLFAKGKPGSFMALNAFHTSWMDSYFQWHTSLGDGLFAVVLSLLLFVVLKKRKLGFLLLLAYSLTGIVAQVIKPIIHSPRPKAFFYPGHLPFFIDDIIHSGNSSFPSGHTVTAFALATVLVFFTAKKWLQMVLLLLAISVGFSRIYLSQHFLQDVLAGSFIGVMGAVLCIHWCGRIDEQKLLFWKRSRQA